MIVPRLVTHGPAVRAIAEIGQDTQRDGDQVVEFQNLGPRVFPRGDGPPRQYVGDTGPDPMDRNHVSIRHRLLFTQTQTSVLISVTSSAPWVVNGGEGEFAEFCEAT